MPTIAITDAPDGTGVLSQWIADELVRRSARGICRLQTHGGTDPDHRAGRDFAFWEADQMRRRGRRQTHGIHGRPALQAQPDPVADATLECALMAARAGLDAVAILPDGRTIEFSPPAENEENQS